jgi:hypothetical protein
VGLLCERALLVIPWLVHGIQPTLTVEVHGDFAPGDAGATAVGGSEPPFWLSGQAGDNATSASNQSWDGTMEGGEGESPS